MNPEWWSSTVLGIRKQSFNTSLAQATTEATMQAYELLVYTHTYVTLTISFCKNELKIATHYPKLLIAFLINVSYYYYVGRVALSV